MCAGRFQLPLPALPSNSEPRPFRSQGYQQAGCGGTGHKLNSQKWVCMGGRCLLPTRTCEWEPSYTLMKKDFGNRCIQLRYTWVQAQRFHMLFSQPFPATNMRTLAAPSTVKQDAGGLCPVLSSHREACLEASCQLAAFLWQGEGSSILRQEVPRLPLYCTWRYLPGLHC